MEPLKIGQIRVYLKGGSSYDCPEANKNNVIRCVGKNVLRIEHYKPAKAESAPKAEAPKAPVKDKASLLGKFLKDNKINAGELIEWIEKKSKSAEDIVIVMKGETRKTVKSAAKNRIGELL